MGMTVTAILCLVTVGTQDLFSSYTGLQMEKDFAPELKDLIPSLIQEIRLRASFICNLDLDDETWVFRDLDEML